MPGDDDPKQTLEATEYAADRTDEAKDNNKPIEEEHEEEESPGETIWEGKVTTNGEEEEESQPNEYTKEAITKEATKEKRRDKRRQKKRKDFLYKKRETKEETSTNEEINYEDDKESERVQQEKDVAQGGKNSEKSFDMIGISQNGGQRKYYREEKVSSHK